MTNEISAKQQSRNYWIVFTCMFLQAIPFGVAQNIQPLFIPYVTKSFGFTLGAFSLIFTVGALASAVCSPFLGKLFGKVPIKILFLVGTLLSALGFLGFGFATSLPQFYLFSAISQVGCVLFSGLGVPYVINNWFPSTGRGKALGIAFSGGSIGNIFLQPLTSTLLASKGVQFSYIAFGLISIIASLPVVLFLIRLPKPNEVQAPEQGKQTPQQGELTGPGIKETLQNTYFWLFSISYAIIAIAISALSTQYATYFTNDLNLDAGLVGILGSTFALFCLFGNVGGGALFDKIGTLKTMSISFVLSIIAIIGLLLSGNISQLAFLFSVAYGLNVYSYMSAPAFMASDVFGKKESSVKLGIISLLFACGFALGSTLFGFVVDHYGFRAGWIFVLSCVVLGYVLLLSSIVRVKKHAK